MSVCGYCGQKRDEEDTLCPNTADAFHTWDSEPWKTEAICEQRHLREIAMDYPTEQQAQERELARIYWQKEEVRNELRALKLGPYRAWCEKHKQAPPCTVCDYDVTELRAKLTSWPAMFSKWFDVKRALALGWWYQFRLDLVAVAIAILLVAVCGWLSVR